MVSPENEPQPAYSTDWHGMIAARSDRRFSLQEVAKHNTRDDCWIIIHGNVYDVTGYLKEHPGGADSILVHAGGDATVEFESIHSDDAQQMKEMVCIGILYETEKDLLGCVKRCAFFIWFQNFWDY
jgi:cytochrome b involved in lipid metabolism